MDGFENRKPTSNTNELETKHSHLDYSVYLPEGSAKEQIKKLNKKLSELVTYLAESENTSSILREQLHELREKHQFESEEHTNDIRGKNEEISRLNGQLSKETTRYQTLDQNFTDVKSRHGKLKIELEKETEKYQELNLEKSRLEREKRALKEENKWLQQLRDDMDRHCREEYHQKMELHIKTIEKKYNSEVRSQNVQEENYFQATINEMTKLREQLETEVNRLTEKHKEVMFKKEEVITTETNFNTFTEVDGKSTAENIQPEVHEYRQLLEKANNWKVDSTVPLSVSINKGDKSQNDDSNDDGQSRTDIPSPKNEDNEVPHDSEVIPDDTKNMDNTDQQLGDQVNDGYSNAIGVLGAYLNKPRENTELQESEQERFDGGDDLD